MNTSITTITDYETATSFLSGTHLVGHIDGLFYSDLCQILGEPTFSDSSGDDKVNKEWVVKFQNKEGEERIFTIYDWKTFNCWFTMTGLSNWNVGGTSNPTEFIEYLKSKI